MEVIEHKSLVKQPKFKDVYEEWLKHKKSLKKYPTDSTIRNYELSYNRFEKIHSKIFMSVRVADIQPIADSIKEKSDSTVTMTKSVISQMYDYALKHEYVDKNYADMCVWECTDTETITHIPFSDNEISKLWNSRNIPGVDTILIMIYTGLRASEMTGVLRSNINLKKQYFTGGIKTSAGTNRIIPIHNNIYPIIQTYHSFGTK